MMKYKLTRLLMPEGSPGGSDKIEGKIRPEAMVYALLLDVDFCKIAGDFHDLCFGDGKERAHAMVHGFHGEKISKYVSDLDRILSEKGITKDTEALNLLAKLANNDGGAIKGNVFQILGDLINKPVLSDRCTGI